MNKYCLSVMRNLALCTVSFTPYYTQAESFTYWYSPNFMQPRFYTAEEGCDFLYSDAWWPHFKSIYMPSNNYYMTPSRYRCAQKNLQTGQFTQYFGDIYPKTIECTNGASMDITTGTCQLVSQKGQPSADSGCSTPNLSQGNPINSGTGNKYQHEIDFLGTNYSFGRYYNSLDGLWRHEFSSHLIFSSNNIQLIKNDGSEHYFTKGAGGTYYSATDKGSIRSDQENYIYLEGGEFKYKFNQLGKLISIINNRGNLLSLNYIENSINLLADGTKIAEFSEDSLHQPLSFSAPTVSIKYNYEFSRLNSAVKTYQGAYKTRNYHYEAPNNRFLLTGVTDENGVRFASWSYDTQGRAITSQHVGGANKITLSYKSDGSTRVTNEYGKNTTYRFLTVSGAKRITAIEGQPTPNCPSSNSTFTYDAQGLLKTKTDAKGNLTTYDYNDRGLETSRNEASGTPQARTTTTEWHPTLFLKTKVTEPSRITTYQYDAQGRQTGQIVTPR